MLADKGYFDKELLKDFNNTGSPFGMHLDRLKVKGVDASTGSLGHGLSMAVGLALGARLKKKELAHLLHYGGRRTARGVDLGSGDVRPASLSWAISRRSSTIISSASTVPCEDVMGIEPLAKTSGRRLAGRSSMWTATTLPSYAGQLEEARAYKKGPCVIIAHTVKGKGVDFMENVAGWHYGGLDADNDERGT